MGKPSRDKGGRAMREARQVLCEILDVPCVPILTPTGKQALGTKAAPDLTGFPFAVEVKWYKKLPPSIERQAREQAIESAQQYDGIPLVMLREDGRTRWRIQIVTTYANGRHAWMEFVNNKDLWHTGDFRKWREQYIRKAQAHDREKGTTFYEDWLQAREQ